MRDPPEEVKSIQGLISGPRPGTPAPRLRHDQQQSGSLWAHTGASAGQPLPGTCWDLPSRDPKKMVHRELFFAGAGAAVPASGACAGEAGHMIGAGCWGSCARRRGCCRTHDTGHWGQQPPCSSCVCSGSWVQRASPLGSCWEAPPGSSAHGILQKATLERVAVSSSRGSSQPGDWTRVSFVSFIGRWVLYH